MKLTKKRVESIILVSFHAKKEILLVYFGNKFLDTLLVGC